MQKLKNVWSSNHSQKITSRSTETVLKLVDAIVLLLAICMKHQFDLVTEYLGTNYNWSGSSRRMFKNYTAITNECTLENQGRTKSRALFRATQIRNTLHRFSEVILNKKWLFKCYITLLCISFLLDLNVSITQW